MTMILSTTIMIISIARLLIIVMIATIYGQLSCMTDEIGTPDPNPRN